MHILQTLPLDRTTLAPTVQKAIDRLQVGAILEVFSTSREGRRGLLIDDQFLPADESLPLPDGVRVRVRVQANADKLILKLIPDRTPPKEEESHELKELMHRLVATPLLKEAVKSLRNALTDVRAAPPHALPEDIVKGESPKAFVITPDTLEDSRKVMKVLQQLGDPLRLSQHLEKARQEPSVKESLPTSLKLLFFKLEENLRLAAQPPALPQITSPATNKEPVDGEAKAKAQEILVGLKNLEIDEIEPKAAREVLETIRRELKETLRGKGDEKEIRKVSKRGAQAIKELLEDHKNDESTTTSTAPEEMLRGQELLSLFNPIVQELGQPQLLIFPLGITPLLQRGELSVDTPKVEDDGESKKEGGGGGTSLHLTLPFPGLGDVGVQAFYSPSQLYIALTFEHEEIARFADTHLALLRERMSELGFSKIELSARAGEVRPKAPGWTRELLGTSIIA